MFIIKKQMSQNLNDFTDPSMIFAMNYQLLKCIDKEYAAFNLRIAYYMYKLLKYQKKSKKTILKMTLLSLILNIGQYSINLKDLEITELEKSYLIIKYLTPLKSESKLLLKLETPSTKKTQINRYAKILKMLIEFEQFRMKYQIKKEDINRCGFDNSNYFYHDYTDFMTIIKNGIIDLNITEDRMVNELSKQFNDPIAHKISKGFLRLISFYFEMYSQDTLDHSRSTALICAYLAYKLKLSNYQIKKMYLSGLVHDMGKIMIDKSILEKPAKLTEVEYKEIQKHVIYTKEILSVYFNSEVVAICSKHHERLNGSGYPNGLTEEFLSIEDRILAVSDIISALIIKRCYTQGFTLDEVSSILNKQKEDKLLDGNIIDTYIKHNKRINKIAKIPILETKLMLQKMIIEAEKLNRLNKIIGNN